MLRKKTQARLGAMAVAAVARRRLLRRATVRAGGPAAKVGWGAGKLVAKHKARSRMEQIGTVGRTAGTIAVVYGPMAAEVLRLVDAPKPKRRAPAFVAGLVIGAGASYLLNRQLRD
jgi:hypothetical protein